MSHIKRRVRPDRPTWSWAAAIPALALAAASLSGCAHTSMQQDAPAQHAKADSLNTKPLVVFSSCAKPVWPKDALARRSQGTTTLAFLIDANGDVAQSSVRKSSGDASLDEAARTAVAQCKFRPAVSDGKPARAWVPVQYVWTLAP